VRSATVNRPARQALILIFSCLALTAQEKTIEQLSSERGDQKSYAAENPGVPGSESGYVAAERDCSEVHNQTVFGTSGNMGSFYINLWDSPGIRRAHVSPAAGW
jgi:hypothetical protein